MLYVGIDPGQSGGLAWVNTNGVPTAIAFSKVTEKDLWIDPLSRLDALTAYAMIENVHSMPKQGVASSFKFGRNFGKIEGLLIASSVPYELVSPQVWQRRMGCLTHGDKNVSKAAAQRLFPQLKITHAIADALLIAEYCRRTVIERTP